jgi:hypothetical protein
MARKLKRAKRKAEKRGKKTGKSSAHGRLFKQASSKNPGNGRNDKDRHTGVVPPVATLDGADDISNLDASKVELLSQLLQIADAELRPDLLIESHPILREILSRSARVDTAAIFGAMLLDDRLQSNCGRLEALIHIAVAIGTGSALATQKQLSDCFNELGKGICGRTEDPAEDVFVSLVTTSEGNFRVLEGIWESGTFYLQRILDIVETFPDEESFAILRRHIFALLRLSEAVCDRANLARYSVGANTPRLKIAAAFCSRDNRTLVFFNADALARLGITREDVNIFTFDDQLLTAILTSPIANSPLDRFPILNDGDCLALVLPTAVSSAIRTAVVDFLVARGLNGSLRRNLAIHYAALLQETRLLGSFDRAPICFSDNEGLPIAEAMIAVDKGRNLHFLFFTDTLECFDETGLAGQNPSPAQHLGVLASRVHAAITFAKQQSDYRGGVTLMVHCGLGRGLTLPIPRTEEPDWSIQAISMPDLHTLSWTTGFTALTFWKALEGVKRVEELGVQIHNMNGLLNLIAWIDRNEGHLVSPSRIPKSFRGSRGGLFIAANFILDLRSKTANENDVHGVRNINGRIEVVRRLEYSHFSEDNTISIFAVDHFSNENGIPLVYVSGARSWWCHVVPPEDGRGGYDRWLMLKTWLPRIVQVIEPRVNSGLKDVVLLRVIFRKTTDDPNDVTLPTRDEIERSCCVEIDAQSSTVTVSIGGEFEKGLCQPANVSERVLVVAICGAFASLARVTFTARQLREIESRIVENDDARQLHAFQAREFRDFVQDDLRQDLIQFDDRDVADLRAGLAFRIESRADGRSLLRNERQCTRLLNAVIRDLENEICLDLHLFDRSSFVEMALRNHEKGVAEQKRWMRTARANLALHRDKEATLRVINEHDLELNAAILPSRVLIEFAICECPKSGALSAGKLDLAKLMTKVNAIWRLGGWSDAIHLGAMQPSLSITPLGDIQAITEFDANVLMPFARKNADDRIGTAVEEYEKMFRLHNVERDRSDSEINPEFEKAWFREVGFSTTDLRKFTDAVEDLGIDRKQSVLRLKRSELRALLEGEFETKTFDAILDRLALWPRTSWRKIPDGFHDKDIQPWRFRRQLSVVRRPIIGLDSSQDPDLIVAPGIVRDSSSYIVRGYYEGGFPDSQFQTEEMRSWCGKRANERGSDFAKLVSKKIQELGWTTAKCELEVKQILRRRSDPEFGDIARFGDVDVLAWNEAAKRVLVIECKNLHFHKTAGEIAEQLSDYRGRTRRNGKPDDLLKHLRRLDILNARKKELCGFLGVHTGVRIEGWILFKHPVPMMYAWKEFAAKIQIATYDDIEQVLAKG